MEKINILAVDDEPSILFSIKNCLDKYNVSTIDNPIKALESVKDSKYNIIIVDYKMPVMNGIELLIKIKEIFPDYIGILLTAYANKEILEEALNKDLVMNVIEKPFDLEDLKSIIDIAIIKINKQKEEIEKLAKIKLNYEELRNKYIIPRKIIGLDNSLHDVYEKIKSSAQYPVNILLTGETGTGKEMAADLIHEMSKRKDENCIKINCAAIPENLLEGELFGYTKGAYTDAKTDKKGKIELAHKGTLFLDEIGEMKLELQAKLLRVLQDKTIERLGSNKQIDVDFRLISATNIDLKEAIKNKTFREDLYYRLNGFPIELPPLREWKEDFNEFIDYFVEKICVEMDIKVKEVESKVFNKLRNYLWPGNIRELKNAIMRSVILSHNTNIISADIFNFLENQSITEDDYIKAVKIISKKVIDNEIDIKFIEKEILNEILNYFNGNVLEASKHTNIMKDKFYRNRKDK